MTTSASSQSQEMMPVTDGKCYNSCVCSLHACVAMRLYIKIPNWIRDIFLLLFKSEVLYESAFVDDMFSFFRNGSCIQRGSNTSPLLLGEIFYALMQKLSFLLRLFLCTSDSSASNCEILFIVKTLLIFAN